MTNISYTVINVRVDLDHSMSAHEISYHLNCDCRQEISLNVRLNLLYQTRFESLGPRLVHIARCNFYVWNTQRNFRRWVLVYVVILQREREKLDIEWSLEVPVDLEKCLVLFCLCSLSKFLLRTSLIKF